MANDQLITDFYTAFARQDPAPMRAAYAPDAVFHDPAFGELRGDDIGDMWTMLCGQAKDFRLEFRDVTADARTGSAHWEAWYKFGSRPVHNVIEASFEFRDALITRHTDEFSFYNWSKQAMGPLGLALGWTPLLPMMVQRQARAGLRKWQHR